MPESSWVLGPAKRNPLATPSTSSGGLVTRSYPRSSGHRAIAELTLDETVDSQRDLDALCLDRRLTTSEIFPPNAYYGGDAILKDFAGIARDRSLKAVVPHGPYLNRRYLWEAEKRVRLPAVFSFPDYRNEVYEQSTDKVIIPGASPFVYVVETLKGYPPPERRGTIVFPSHSTHRVVARTNSERMAAALQELPAEYHPITVCVYWRDYLLGQHRHYANCGFNLVSAGHIFDPFFFPRLYHLCSLHAYATSNDLGSHIFYSVKSGCSYFQLSKEEPEFLFDDPGVEKDDIPPFSADVEEKLMALFSGRSASLTEQLVCADYYLGTDKQRSPEGLMADFEAAERWDRRGYVLERADCVRRYVAPPRIIRAAGLLKRRIYSRGADSRLDREGSI